MEHVSAPAAVHPLVVVPGEHLDEGVDGHGAEAVDDRAVVVADDVAADDRVSDELHDALESRGLASSLEGVVDLLLGDLLLDVDGEIDEGASDGRDTERDTVHRLRREGLDDLRKSDGSASAGRDDVHGGSPSPPEVLVHHVADNLVVGVGVDGGHEAAGDAERVVQGLGDWGKAVGRAAGVGDALGLWLEVLENSEKWTESVLYLQQLCEFSVSNIVSCHHGEVDLYLIEKIRGGCHEDVLFRLLSSIAVHISSMPVVERFVSLFAPGDDKLQSIFGKVMKTLTTIVSMDMKEPQTLLPLVEESQVKMPYTLTVSTGFSFGCWFYLESASMKSFPLLLSTKTNDSKYFHVFVAGGVLQYSRAENPRAKSLTTVTKLPVREWCFICVTYRVHNQYSYIISRINNGEEEVIEKGTKKFPTGVVNMSFGGMIEGSNRTEAFSVLGPFGVFGVLSEEQVRNLWGKGPNRFEYEAPNPLFMYCPYNRYEYRTSSLSRVLVAQCKLPILFPLLLIENQSEHSSGTILDSLLDLITSMLITNPDVEAEFKPKRKH